MLSRNRSTLLGKKLFQNHNFSTSKQSSWHYVVPLPFDATTLIPYSQPFIISPLKQLSVFELGNVFKNPDKLFWLADPHRENYDYLGYTQDALKKIGARHILSDKSYEKLMLINEGKFTIEEFNRSLDDEQGSMDEFTRIYADIKLAIANDLTGKVEGFGILDRIGPGYYRDCCATDIWGVKFMMQVRFLKKLKWDVLQSSDLYEIFMMYLTSCQNDYSRSFEYYVRRNAEGNKQEPPVDDLHKMFVSLLLHPIVKTPTSVLKCDFSYPIKYMGAHCLNWARCGSKRGRGQHSYGENNVAPLGN